MDANWNEWTYDEDDEAGVLFELSGYIRQPVRLGEDENFGRLKAQLHTTFGVPTACTQLQHSGELLGDNDTPRSKQLSPDVTHSIHVTVNHRSYIELSVMKDGFPLLPVGYRQPKTANFENTKITLCSLFGMPPGETVLLLNNNRVVNPSILPGALGLYETATPWPFTLRRIPT